MPDRPSGDTESGQILSHLDVLVRPARDQRRLLERLQHRGLRHADRPVHLWGAVPRDEAVGNLVLKLPRMDFVLPAKPGGRGTIQKVSRLRVSIAPARTQKGRAE